MKPLSLSHLQRLFPEITHSPLQRSPLFRLTSPALAILPSSHLIFTLLALALLLSPLLRLALQALRALASPLLRLTLPPLVVPPSSLLRLALSALALDLEPAGRGKRERRSKIVPELRGVHESKL